MKKILAIFLALITVLSITLVACNKDNTTKGNNTDDDGDDGDLIVGSQSTGDSEQDGSDAGSDSGKADTSDWESLGENGVTIYSMVDNLNVRKSANANGTNNIYSSQLSAGQSVTAKAKATLRSGGTDYAWYKIDFNGNEGYVLAEYMTTNKNDTVFKELDTPEKLTIKEDKEVNARLYPAFGSQTPAETLDRAATVNGKLEKVGVNESGNIWIVEYTKAGTTTAKTYYIGNLAFENFEGYGSQGGIG